MIIYPLTFFISSLLFYTSHKNSNKQIKKALLLIAVMIPSIIAGIRSESVGTDVKVYVIRFFKLAANSESLRMLFAKLAVTGEVGDYGYHALNYITTRFTDNYHWGLFIYAFLFISFTYAASRRFYDKYNAPAHLQVLLILFAYYNVSLNNVRQSIAMAISFYALSLMIEKQYKKYVVFTILAFLFHGSALVSLFVFSVFLLLKEDGKDLSHKRIFGVVATIGALLGGAAFSKQIVTYLVNLGVVRANYLNYLAGGKYADHLSLSIYNVIIAVVCFGTFLFFYFRNHNKYQNELFFLIISLTAMLLSFASVVSVYSTRILCYFMPLVFEAQLMNRTYFKKSSRVLWVLFVLCLVIFVWYHDIVINNYNETLPYTYSLLG